MRFMIMGKATAESEKDGALPDPQLMADMGKFNEELIKAGILLASDGAEPCQDKRPQESLLPPLPRNLNRGRMNRFPSLSIDWFPWVGRSSTQNPRGGGMMNVIACRQIYDGL